MAVPKRVVKPIPVKGLFQSLPGDAIGPSYSPNALNVRFRFGEVKPTPGRGLFSGVQVAQEAQALGQFGLTTDISWLFYLTRTKLYRRGNLAPFTPNSWKEITGTFTPTGTQLWSWTTGEDHLFFCRGTEELAQWDGNPASQFDLVENVAGFEPIGGVAGVSPAPKFLEYFGDRVMCANVKENGVLFSNRLRWSERGDYRKWNDTLGTGAGWLDIPMEASESINGMKALGNQLAVYSKSSVVSVVETGQVDPAFIYRILVRGMGLVAPYTLAKANQVHFFLGKDMNVWAWDGIQIQSVGDPVWKEIQALAHLDAVNTYFGFVAHKRREYWLVLADITRGTYEAFIYDFSTNSWSRDTFPSLTAAVEAEVLINSFTWDDLIGSWDEQTFTWEQLSGTLTPFLVGGRSDSSTMVIDEGYAYDYFAVGSIMDCFLETEDHYCPDEGPWKLQEVVRVILVYDPKVISGDPIEVGVSFNQGSTWTTQLVTPSSVGFSYADFNKTGQLVRYRFREQNANVQFRWRSYGYQYVVSGDTPPGATA